MNHWMNEGKEYLKKDEFKHQGRSKKQYEDSGKILVLAAIGLFALILLSTAYNLIFG